MKTRALAAAALAATAFLIAYPGGHEATFWPRGLIALALMLAALIIAAHLFVTGD